MKAKTTSNTGREEKAMKGKRTGGSLYEEQRMLFIEILYIDKNTRPKQVLRCPRVEQWKQRTQEPTLILTNHPIGLVYLLVRGSGLWVNPT